MTHTTHTNSILVRIAALAGSLAFACTLPAQTPAWFPLEVGNTWVFRPTRGTSTPVRGMDPRVIDVHGTEKVDGRDYFNVSYFGREVLLRVEPTDGSVVIHDKAAHTDLIWTSLNRPVGSTYATEINPCPSSAEIAARDATVTTPAGAFSNAVQVNYNVSCPDAGATKQYYAPDIGLVRSEETSFAGPLILELAYYRVGDRSGSGPEVSFTVGIDGPKYPTGGTLTARLTLRNTSKEKIHLHFPSGQSFDLRILNAQGETVYLWSATRLFTMIVRDEDFGPGERTYSLTAPLDRLPPGRYTARAYLTTDPVAYEGTTQFEIADGLSAQLVEVQ